MHAHCAYLIAMSTRLPPLYPLQAFMVTARVGSFTSAAQELHLTQSAVSRQVQLLEEYFGCPLFVRHARGLSLTAEGLELLPAATQALTSLSQASERVRRSMGELSIQLPPTFALRWFLPRLPQLKQALPNVEVRVATHLTDAPDFDRPDVDAIVAHGKGAWPNVQAVLVMKEIHTVYCSPEVAKRLKTPADLAGVTLLHANRDRGEWLAWLRGVNLESMSVAREQMFDTVNMCLEAARAGQGVAVADPVMLAQTPNDPTLVAPFAERVPSDNNYYLTYPRERADQAKIIAFQRWLLSAAAEPARTAVYEAEG
jgi:LysR family transcriptional regulator, glycine cleavage system transcriptional activator